MKLKIKTQSELFNLRAKLQRLSNTSFAYSKLNKANPLDSLTEQDAQELIQAYKDLLEEAK